MKALDIEVFNTELFYIVISFLPVLLSFFGKFFDIKFYSDLNELFEKIEYGRFRRRLYETLEKRSFSNIYRIILGHMFDLAKEALKKTEEKESAIDFITNSTKKIEEWEYPPPEEFKDEMRNYVNAVDDIYMLEAVYEEMRKKRRNIRYTLTFASLLSFIIACLMVFFGYNPYDLLFFGIYGVLLMMLTIIPSNYYREVYEDAKKLLEELYENNAKNVKDIINIIVYYEQNIKEYGNS